MAARAKVLFVHPDLGIGGAERLVVDAAVVLQQLGHEVTISTSHHDRTHCFEETRDGTLNVFVYGDFLPRTIFGAMYLVCSILRGLFLALMIVLYHRDIDVIFCDQLSISIPILRLTGAKILFYCHFPDKLLAKHDGFLKKLYRIPLDWLEERTTAASDTILVNSRFTASVFSDAFPSIHSKPLVLYPSINFASYDRKYEIKPDDIFYHYSIRRKSFVLSINRFERKKNIPLAVHAFAMLSERLGRESFQKISLVIAGGYDTRVAENVEHLTELQTLVQQYNLSFTTVMPNEILTSEAKKQLPDAQVLFLPSFSESQRSFLLSHASVLVYTPTNEHFGIVPVEAMYAGLPVVAVNSGGPTESILHEKTGLLVEGEPTAFAEALARILSGSLNAKALGKAGRTRVQELYSLTKFGKELDACVQRLYKQRAAEQRRRAIKRKKTQ